MSGQGSYGGGEEATSSAAGCALREGRGGGDGVGVVVPSLSGLLPVIAVGGGGGGGVLRHQRREQQQQQQQQQPQRQQHQRQHHQGLLSSLTHYNNTYYHTNSGGSSGSKHANNACCYTGSTNTAGESSSTMNSYGNYELACFLWGRGEDGQLGIGDTSDQESPTYVDSLRGVGIHQIACGSGHTVVLTRDGEVYTWGRGDDGRLGHGDNGWKYVPRIVQSFIGLQISQITCGSYHTAAVDAVNGDLYTWGGGMYGKLGHGNESGHATPKRVEGLSGIPICQIACGSRHTAVVTHSGALYTWGDKENGVTGHTETSTTSSNANNNNNNNQNADGGHQYTPKLLDRFRGRRILQLSACGFHTGCIVAPATTITNAHTTEEDTTDDESTTVPAVLSTKEVYTWGEGKFGRLGHNQERNSLFPRVVEALSGKNPKQIACGGFHTAVVTEDGLVYTFGGGEHGQLGHGDKVNKLQPTLVTALVYDNNNNDNNSNNNSNSNSTIISQITCGWSHSVALSEDGKVWTWGNGDHGKLGLGNGRKYSTPQMVDKLAPYRVVKIASYNEHTAALVDPYDECGNGILNMSSYSSAIGTAAGLFSGTRGVTTNFLNDLRSMVNEDEFSDVTFVVEGGHHIHAHRAILAKRCEHFGAMFRSGMRESVEREIIIPNIPLDAFKLMLEFLYTDGVKRNIDVEHAVDLYVAADLYQLDRLKEMCIIVVKRNMNVGNVTFLINEASNAQCQTIKDICMEYMILNFDVLSKREEIKILSHSLLLELLARRP